MSISATIRMDRNGSKCAAIKVSHERAFSVQTCGNLRHIHYTYAVGETVDLAKDPDALFDVRSYVSACGTDRQRAIMQLI